MNRTLLFGVTFFMAIVGVSLIGGEGKAIAGHGCHGYVGCYGGFSYRSYRGCWGRTNLHRRPVIYRHAYAYSGRYRCHGWADCHGYASCYGVSCYGASCYGVSCYGGPVIEREAPRPAPETPDQPTPTPGDTSIHGSAVLQAAVLQIKVPHDAKVYVNGHLTSSTGSERRYISKGMLSGRNYKFSLRSEIVRDAKHESQTQIVTLQAGQKAELTFNFTENDPRSIAIQTTAMTQ